MQGTLKAYGIETLALSKDTVAQAARHRRDDSLTFTLLSDPELKVIQQFGVLHEGALEFNTFFVAGMPMGWPAGRRKMAVPTTLLIDEDGLVRWIDQCDDYRLRGDEARIRGALEATFGPLG